MAVFQAKNLNFNVFDENFTIQYNKQQLRSKFENMINTMKGIYFN